MPSAKPAAPALNGKHSTHGPNGVLRAQAAWRVSGVPALELLGQLSHEGKRAVLPDESIQLPAWTRLDAALRCETKAKGVATAWTPGIHNRVDQRYGKESPTQFAHTCLFPGAPRTPRLTFQASS